MNTRDNPFAVFDGEARRSQEVILLVDDDECAIDLMRAWLEPMGGLFEIVGASSVNEALTAARDLQPGLVFLDLVMPGVQGMDLLEQILACSPGAGVVVVTAHYSTDSAVEAIHKGAYDYLTKPLSMERIRGTVQRWLDELHERDQASEMDLHLAELSQFEGLVGRSQVMVELFSRIGRIAPHYTTVLVAGETGTGKELVARALHQLSPVKNGPFVVCNCAAIPETLFESELFGHTKGSFTGADSDKKGMIESASGGVLFLDEIGEVPCTSQAKLLRFLQSREVQRVGDATVRKLDVRVVAATNCDLAAMARERTFREDLYYRLAMVLLRTPRLADRPEDVILLAEYFLKRIGKSFGKPALKMSRRTSAMIRRYNWPGNVRELENALHYCAMMARRDVIEPEDFPESIQCGDQQASVPDPELVTLEEFELRYVNHVVKRCAGNRTLAAQILGIGRATVYRILNRQEDRERTDQSPRLGVD